MKMKRIISALLIFIMLLSGGVFTAFGAEAGDSDDDPVVPAKVSNLKAYSAYKGVALEWSPSKGAVSYNVYRNGKLIKRGVKKKAYDSKKKYSYYDRTDNDNGKTYKYCVRAVSAYGRKSPKSNVVKGKNVMPMYISVTFRTSRTLTSHDKGHVTHTFKQGQTVDAHSFKFGKYIFRYKDHTYYVNYTSLRGYDAHWTRKVKYSDKDAEYFINTSRVDSDTKYLVWASLYTQRLYVFKGSKGKWRVYKNLNYNGVKAYKWIISSGKATSPSPAGLWFHIYRKKRIQRGVNYLSFYHSETSLHGKVGKDRFDTLRSGGCIRNPDKYALIIYKKLPIGTRVVIY